MPKTILLADDSLTIRKVVELTFTDSDFRVESVGSGQEALDRLETTKPDLVLADVVMPEPSGYEICEKIKTSEKPVPVLLLAGTFEPFDEERARACGADGHLVKPFESTILLDRVQALLVPPPAPETVADDSAGIEEVLQDLDAVTESEGDASTPAPPAEEKADTARSATETVPGTDLGPEQINAIARAVVEQLSTEAIRAIAWEVVPDVAERLIRERIQELEQDPDE
ncbi:MAG: response regulator [Acidobacteriota bacterium]|nr:response regulator [Acidobacteriota bacterium]